MSNSNYPTLPEFEYVLGWRYSLDLKEVVVIEKQRPAELQGRITGIGGRIENDESPLEAMVREFKEETSLQTYFTEWECFDIWDVHQDCRIYVFASAGTLAGVSTVTDERVGVFNVDELIADVNIMFANRTWRYLVEARKNIIESRRVLKLQLANRRT